MCWRLIPKIAILALPGCLAALREPPLACRPFWLDPSHPRYDDGKCPFGVALPGDVTLQDKKDPMLMIATVYSLAPYVWALLFGLRLVIYRGTAEAIIPVWCFLVVMFNELVVKMIFAEPRPGYGGDTMLDGHLIGSCLESCGMPSSHAALATGFLCLVFFDGIYRTVPRSHEMVGSKIERPDICVGCCNVPNSLCFKEQWSFLRSCPIFLSQRNAITHPQFTGYLVFWMILMLPVPVMRLILFDHTDGQVCWGVLEGMATACIYSYGVRTWQRWMKPSQGKRYCGGFFVHNFCYPEFEVMTTSSGERELVMVNCGYVNKHAVETVEKEANAVVLGQPSPASV